MKNALLVLHQKRSRPGAIGNALLSRGFKLDIRTPALGDKLPTSMNNHDLAVIFGGPMSINDLNLNYIKYEIDWINIALSSNKPFLGICLGAQMLAQHLGGKIYSSPDQFIRDWFFSILCLKMEVKKYLKNKLFFFNGIMKVLLFLILVKF